MNIDKAALTKRVAEKIIERVLDNWDDHIDEDGSVYIDEETEFEMACHTVLEDSILHSVQRANLVDEIWQSPEIGEALETARQQVKEIADDAKEWAKGPMKYYGLSQSDFI